MNTPTPTEFDKRPEIFPIRRNAVHLLSCGVAAMCGPAWKAEERLNRIHAEQGVVMCAEFAGIEASFHRSYGALMKTDPGNISYVRNSAEALSIIANGYPFAPGDEIISYVHEYPSNHFPWLIQSRRGAVLKLIPDSDLPCPVPAGRPRGIEFSDIEALVTPRTRVVALSHVQFTSGFALDLRVLGAFCRSREIDLVVDFAQSLGAMPFYPEEFGVAAAAGSGWKWLFGPIGSGVMYTSPAFREKIADTVVGPGMMVQGDDFLNHTYAPFEDGRRFEYSTYSYTLMAALEASASQVLLRYSSERIRAEIFRLQDLFLALLDGSKYQPVRLEPENRSGILALIPKAGKPQEIVAAARTGAVLVSTRGGYLRIAPHFYLTDTEMERAAQVLNAL